MSNRLLGQTAIVTGGGRGFGEQICRALAREGANVVVADIDLDQAERVAQAVADGGGAALAHRADIAEESAAPKLVDATLTQFGQVDTLVNNAGVLTYIGPFQDTPTEAWDRVFGVNLRGNFFCIRAVLPHMIERQAGHIINITSNVARIGFLKGRRTGAYVATKFGMEGLTWSLSLELAEHNIRVNAVAPELSDTHFYKPEQRANMNGRECWAPEHVVPPLIHLLVDSKVTGTSIDAEEWHEKQRTKDRYCFVLEVEPG